MTLARISLDTETAEKNIPFIATTCDTKLQTKLYDIKNKWRDFQELKYICASKDVIKTFHAATYDIYALSLVGIFVKGPIDCTLIAASLLNENFAPRKLKVMAKRYLDEPCLEDAELRKIKSKYRREAKKGGYQFYYDQIPANILYPYAKQDAVYTIKLWFYFEEELKKYTDLYNMEKRLIPIIVKMQQRGFKVDRGYLKQACIQGKKVKISLDNKLRDYLRNNTNYEENIIQETKFNSTKQLVNIFKTLKIDTKDVTPKGNISTGSKALKKIKDHPFVDLIIKSRDVGKSLSTYWEPLYNRYTTDEKPYARFLFWQSGAKSGRFSAELIQTSPKRKPKIETKFFVRNAFIPREGYTFISIDYSQVEFRLFAHCSNNIKLINAIINGLDVHLATAYDLFGKQIVEETEETRKKYRDMAKTINFGIIYGMGPDKLADSLGIPLMEAYQVLKNYFNTYPVKEYMQQEIESLYKTGVVHVDINSKLMKFERDYRVPLNFAYRSTNLRIQGLASYISKFGMIRLTDWIAKYRLDIHLICVIHDEYIFEVSKKYNIKIIAKKLKLLAEDLITFRVPIEASVKSSSKTWGENKELVV